MKKIKPGCTFAAVSPAGPINPEAYKKAVDTIESAGFSIKQMPHILDREEYLAGNDKDRASDLMNAFEDPDVDAILATRGGYGSIRILDYLDFDVIRKNQKPFIGFSDLTVLQHVLFKKSQLLTYSGPQLVKGWGEDLDDFSRDFWLKMLNQEYVGQELPLPGMQKLQVIHEGSATGYLYGGNLCVLSSMCGTDYTPEFADGILVLEEIDEPAYRIDRMITQLAMSGSLDGVKGILLGGFVQHTKNGVLDWSDHAAEILSYFIPECPVLKAAPYAHIGSCWTLPLGAKVSLNSDKRALTVEEI